MKKRQIYDLETYPNFFLASFKDLDSKKIFHYEISDRKNESYELIKHLNQPNLVLVGYNNNGFDYPILHKTLLEEKREWDSYEIYEIVQEIINEEFSAIQNYLVKIPQIDLYKIWHYDNPARSTSLKWLQFTTRFNKLQDLPFKVGTILNDEEKDLTINYCENDLESTESFYYKSLSAIDFRINVSNKLGHDVMGYSDVKIGEYINRITYERLSGKKWKQFKDKRTYHKNFKMQDIIPDSIKFKSKIFNDFFNSIKNEVFNYDNGDKIDRYINLPEISIKFARGGLHSEDKPKFVKNVKGYLQEKDIGSMYPWTIVSEKIYPKHLGVEWNEGIKSSYFYRSETLKPLLKTLKKGTEEYNKVNAEQEIYKLALNGGGFGKLGSSFNWQYDDLAKYKVTIGGELKMLMLIEELYLANIELISVNTDGVVIHYSEEEKSIVDKIHKDWEKLTTYDLEDTSYNKIIFSTVNDYIAEIIDPITKETLYNKYKGDFEIDKDFHKNNSQRIVPIALSKYFINNIPIEETIRNHTDIYDFCIGRNKRSADFLLTTKEEPIIINDKIIRYYISNSHQKLFKRSNGDTKKKEGALEAINKGYNVTLFMNYQEKDNYNINYQFYINECNKIIKPIEFKTNDIKIKQLSLF